mmetsp:Transcript_8502/g.16730  ORF Transcript_8502/g.16730 Transcript_8502/m.16730 type:complete len:271 (-) Transcript_8502:247-1059(-)
MSTSINDSGGDTSTACVCCGIKMNKKIRTLMIALVLFLTISIAQLIGALIANSLALLSDTSSMFLDSATYAVNIYAESQDKKDVKKTQRRMLIASGVSFFALLGITVYFLCDALTIILSDDEEDDDVNAYIVLAFAVVGLVFDLASLSPYCVDGVEQGDASDHTGKMNMCSALSHVLSDTMRSITTLVESIILLNTDINGARADAYASLVVSSLIILGLIKSLMDWRTDVVKMWNGETIEGEERLRDVAAEAKDEEEALADSEDDGIVAM